MSESDRSAPTSARRTPGARLIWGSAVLVILISLVVCAGFRRQHFQELDSYAVGDFFTDPRSAVVQYALFGYGVGHARPDQGAAAEAIRAAPDFALRAIGRTSIYHRFQAKAAPGAPLSADPSAVRALLTQGVKADSRLSGLGPHALYRMGLFAAISATPLPEMLRRAIFLPLASTYSFGPALVYSAIWSLRPDPAAFMSSATLATVAVFHLAALLLLGALARLRLPPAASGLAAIWFVFASSPYAYAFHLGSTVWMMAATAAFLFVLAKDAPTRQRARRASWATAILVFFSYLVVVFYAAFVVVHLLERMKAKDRPRSWRALVGELLADLWPAAVGVIVCAALFYEPGQGARGGMADISEAPTYLAYILLNLFGIAGSGSTSAFAPHNAIQLLVVVSLLACGAASAWKIARGPDTPARAGARLLGGVILIYGAMCAAGLLAPAPTRHMLFLAPALYLLLAFGLAWTGAQARRIAPRAARAPAAAVLLIVLASGVGIAAQQARFSLVRSALPEHLPAGHFVGVIGNESPAAWTLGLPHLKVADLPGVSGSVLYADSDCDMACLRQNPAMTSADIVRFIPLASYDMHTKMLAFVPPIDERRFPFDRWNRMYMGRIDVARVEPGGAARGVR